MPEAPMPGAQPDLAHAPGVPLTVTLLGTGTSTGVPVIGCACAVCTSADPRDRRLRASAHVVAHAAAGPVHLQIDAGPDLRRQALAHGLAAVDAVLVTHEHFDHVVGLDDLRPFFFANRRAAPVLAPPSAARALRAMFGYIFEDGTYPGVSRLELREVDPTGGAIAVESRGGSGARVAVEPIPAMHGALPIVGWRVGAFAYLTDVSAVPEASVARLAGVDTLVLDGLRPEPHPSHLSFDEAVEVAARIGARETWLTHLTHLVPHADVEARLPDGVRPAYDGLVLNVGG